MEKKSMILLLSLVFLGLGLTVSINSSLSGAAVTEESAISFSSPILGLLLLMMSGVLLSMSKSLESLVDESTKKKMKNKEKFINNHLADYKNYLEREGKLPQKVVTEQQKLQYAKRQLDKKFGPLSIYNDKVALDYLQHFKETPERSNEGKKFKAIVTYDITDSCMKSLSKKAEKDSRIKKAAASKIFRLTTGNMGQKNTGYKFVPDTCGRFLYLKDKKSGARIFLEKVDDKHFSLVGITSGQQKKKDEEKLIKACQELWKKKYC